MGRIGPPKSGCGCIGILKRWRPRHAAYRRSLGVITKALPDIASGLRVADDPASGFSSKREAEDAEAQRRIEEQQKLALAAAGAGIPARLPQTLSMLLEEFFEQHVDQKLAPKTIERYHEQAAYLDPELLKMPIGEITPLHLSREWRRLLERGGHHRHTKTPRPLSAKTVRNIAGVLSSAFRCAEKWGLVSTNPVPRSEPPVPKKRRGCALTTVQQKTVIAAATGPLCLEAFLEVCAGTGARRGEVLALR